MSKDIGKKIDVAVMAYVICCDDGKFIMVDSGTPDPDLSKTQSNRKIFDQRSIIEALAEIGLTPGDIGTIILTHVHWDHAYNLNYFPHADIYVQLSELQYAVKPLWDHLGPYGYSEQNGNPCWFDGFMHMKVMDGDYAISNDIRVFHLPGHTPGMQGVLVNTVEGNFMLASDNIPLFDSYESVRPPVVHVSLADWYRSYQKIRDLSDYILPGHDMEVMKRKIYG